jgi:hypothetical protein
LCQIVSGGIRIVFAFCQYAKCNIVHFAVVNILWIKNFAQKEGWNRWTTEGWSANGTALAETDGMKPKGFSPGSHNEADESEARRTAVLGFADLHNPEARQRILDRANQALKDARALIERLNAMDAKKDVPFHTHAKGGKTSKD